MSDTIEIIRPLIEFIVRFNNENSFTATLPPCEDQDPNACRKANKKRCRNANYAAKCRDSCGLC